MCNSTTYIYNTTTYICDSTTYVLLLDAPECCMLFCTFFLQASHRNTFCAIYYCPYHFQGSHLSSDGKNHHYVWISSRIIMKVYMHLWVVNNFTCENESTKSGKNHYTLALPLSSLFNHDTSNCNEITEVNRLCVFFCFNHDVCAHASVCVRLSACLSVYVDCQRHGER